MNRIASNVIILTTLILLSGCITSSDRPGPEQIAAGVAKDHGVVVADFQFDGRKSTCGATAASAIPATGDNKRGRGGRLEGATYLHLSVNPPPNGAPKPATMPPGRYWIVQIECSGGRRLTLRSKYKGVFPHVDNFIQGLATFDVMPGEVVNLGTISVSMGARAIEIRQRFSPEVIEVFQKEHPELAARMVYRAPRLGSE